MRTLQPFPRRFPKLIAEVTFACPYYAGPDRNQRLSVWFSQSNERVCQLNPKSEIHRGARNQPDGGNNLNAAGVYVVRPSPNSRRLRAEDRPSGVSGKEN